MKKNLITTALLAGLVLSAGIGAARADDQSTIVVNGRITNSTCDISATEGVGANGTSGGVIPLGFAAQSQFVDGTTLVSPHRFKIAFNNCPADASVTGHRALRLTGNTIAGYDAVFNDYVGNTAGVDVREVGATAPLKAGDKIDSGVIGTSVVKTEIPLQVAMVAPNAATVAPVGQNIQATLTFTVDVM